MQIILISFLIFCKQSSEQIKDSPPVLANTTFYIAASPSLSLRKEPNVKGKVIDSILKSTSVELLQTQGEEIEIQGVKGKWSLVKYQILEGWVFGGFLKSELDPPIIKEKWYSGKIADLKEFIQEIRNICPKKKQIGGYVPFPGYQCKTKEKFTQMEGGDTWKAYGEVALHELMEDRPYAFQVGFMDDAYANGGNILEVKKINATTYKVSVSRFHTSEKLDLIVTLSKKEKMVSLTQKYNNKNILFQYFP